MNLSSTVKGVGVFAVLCYVGDVLVRPTFVAKKARRQANSLDLPLLNVGAGTRQSSIRTKLLGPTTWGDYNVDIASSEVCEVPPPPVCYADAHALPFSDNTFGSVILSHCLEHVEDPEAVLAECRRVTAPGGRVYAITPPWWTPHAWWGWSPDAWTHPGHRWIVFGSTTGPKKFLPLWQS